MKLKKKIYYLKNLKVFKEYDFGIEFIYYENYN